MKAWATALGDVKCGHCGLVIRREARHGVLQGEGWQKVRCATCFQQLHAGGQDPGEVVTVPVQSVRAERELQPLSAIASNVVQFDPRKAAANDLD